MTNNQKIWLVGVSEGIGAAVAHKLAAQGAHLVLSARSIDKLETLRNALPNADRHIIVPCDVTSQESVTAAWGVITQQWPKLDMMLYNAGLYEPMSALAWDQVQVERMFDVNLSGAVRVLSLIVPAFVAQNSGHIALVGSVAGYRGLPNSIGYSASKSALNHLAENLKIDLHATNINVQLICPGFVATRLTDKNTFPMPFIITADRAADYIMEGLQSSRFEIHFPRRFSLILKFLGLLPHSLYFWLFKHVKV